MRAPLTIALVFSLALVPTVSAGTKDAPEVSDPKDDAACYAPVGNEYGDIVAGWIDGETETAFNVNIALQKWTVDALGAATGYTLQFTHQDVQFGAVAAFLPAPLGEGWEFSNGFVDTTTGELRDFTDAKGTFTAGTPAVLSIEFSKAIFPHGDMSDNKLVAFTGGSADFKHLVPFFAASQASPLPFTFCDKVESAAEYVFATGTHSMGSASTNATSGDDDATAALVTTTPDDAAATATPDERADTPAPGAAAILAAALLALAGRRKRKA